MTDASRALLDAVKNYRMTDAEKEAQRQSWARGEMALRKSEALRVARAKAEKERKRQ